MGRDIDPDDLSGTDIVYLLAPLIGVIASIVVVVFFLPDLIWLWFLVLIGIGVYKSASISQEQQEALAKARQELDEKTRRTPIVGPFLPPLFFLIRAVSAVGGLVLLVLVLYAAATSSIEYFF